MAKKKRYYQSRKDRMDERRGMDERLYGPRDKMRGMDDEYYMNREHRRAMERDYGRDERKSGPIKKRRSIRDEYDTSRDPRRRREMEDSYMINEDHRATANLPQHVIMKEYPPVGYGYEGDLDDTIRGIDHQIMDDSDEMKREAYPEKY